MIYSTIYGHLESFSTFLSVGKNLENGDIIGIMGDTGQSTGPHLHLQTVEGTHTAPWSLIDKKIKPSATQTNYAAQDIFGYGAPWTTTPWSCEEYFANYRKWHFALDIVPDHTNQNQDNSIMWTRSMLGEVIGLGAHPGYGIYVIVSHLVPTPPQKTRPNQ